AGLRPRFFYGYSFDCFAPSPLARPYADRSEDRTGTALPENGEPQGFRDHSPGHAGSADDLADRRRVWTARAHASVPHRDPAGGILSFQALNVVEGPSGAGSGIGTLRSRIGNPAARQAI